MGFDVNFSLIFCGFLSMVVVGVLLLWICFGGGRFLFDFLCCCCGGGGLFVCAVDVFCVTVVVVDYLISLIFCVFLGFLLQRWQ